MSAFEIVKYFHILFAVIAVGFNASYGIWLARAARQPQHEGYVLRGVKVLDDRFANPAYGLLLVTGLIMVAISPYELTEFWIALALTLYAVMVIVGLVVATPTLRRQIRVLDSEGRDSPEYDRLARRTRLVGILLAVDVLAIVFLMVTRPTL